MIHDSYLALCEIFLPQPIMELSRLAKANRALAALRKKSRDQWTREEHCYHNLVRDLVEAACEDMVARLTHSQNSDGVVLEDLLLLRDRSFEQTAADTGISLRRLEQIHAGDDYFTRLEVNLLASYFAVPVTAFNSGVSLSGKARFRVSAMHPAGYQIYDVSSRRSKPLREEDLYVFVQLPDGSKEEVPRGSLIFATRLQEALNRNEQAIAAKYFPRE